MDAWRNWVTVGRALRSWRAALRSTLINLLVVCLVAGCVSPPKRELSHEAVPYAFLPNGHDPLHPAELPPNFRPSHVYKVTVPAELEQGIIPYYERVLGHALNILELSGGGQFGAFGAGFLKGWTETGRRPRFDVVTGVSTGALLATHAFLGTPADDAVLEEIFTEVGPQDIYRKRHILSLAFGANSAFDTAPLKALIDKYITAEVLERVAAAYDQDRRLLVGATNLDYNDTWVWNLSLIAKDNRPGALELFRKVLLASASFPVAFPPVEIDGYLFADGAARMNAVVLGLTGMEPPPPPKYGPGNVYLIHNGKLIRPPVAVENSFAALAGVGIHDMMGSSMEAIILRSYFGALVHGYQFHLIEIPTDLDVGHNPLAFDSKQMRLAFDTGYALGKRPDPWASVPPNAGDFPPWALERIR